MNRGVQIFWRRSMAILLAMVWVHAEAGSPYQPPRTKSEFIFEQTPSSPAFVFVRPASTDDSHLNKKLSRQPSGLQFSLLGWSYDCTDCHRLIAPRWRHELPMVEHAGVQLRHGNNRFCLNCHHPTNRNAFVDYDGSEIRQTAVVQLCAKCHGPTYRDWAGGAHGRRNGFWNRAKGDQTRVSCVECHDPHDPAFKAVKPLPPPSYPARAAHPPP